MKLTYQNSERGIAMLIVMVTIFVLGVMAASLSFSMRVELTLANNSNLEPELEWIARSGVEYSKWYLSQHGRYLQQAGQAYHSLNQPWAGAPLFDINYVQDNPIEGASLDGVQIGPGKFSVTFTDAERKFNINLTDEDILNQAMAMMGFDASASSTLVDAILDWRDPDSDPRPNGLESDDYLRLDPPYYSKDGPMDDLSEMLFIQGILPEMYWGPRIPADQRTKISDDEYVPTFPVGLVDLFTTIAEPRINVNTTTKEVLMLLPGMDETWATAIVEGRKGPDGIDGTEDDTPYAGVMEMPLPPVINQAIAPYIGVRSTYFEVLIDTQIGDAKKQYMALLRFTSYLDIELLYMHEN